MSKRMCWKVFRGSGAFVLGIGVVIGGMMAALGLLALVILVLCPLYMIGARIGGFTSWFAYLAGMSPSTWVLLVKIIAISPGLIIFRVILPLWWRVISLKITLPKIEE